MPRSSALAFEDTVDIEIDLVDAFVPQQPSQWNGYPFPRLARTSLRESRAFQAILLENDLLRATLVPALGGRVLSLLDKRTGTEILSEAKALTMIDDERRGLGISDGLQIVLDGQPRLNSLGSMDCRLESGDEEDDEAVVWIAEAVTGTGLSFHVRVSMPSDRAELLLEARVLNRSYRHLPYNGGVCARLGEVVATGSAVYCAERRAGLGFFSEAAFEGIGCEQGVFVRTRFDRTRWLAPHQADTWQLAVVPYSGFESLTSAGREGAIDVSEARIRIQTTETRPEHKLLLLTDSGETLEAKVDIYAEHAQEFPLNGITPTSVVLRHPSKADVLRHDSADNAIALGSTRALRSQPVEPEPIELDRTKPEIDLKRATFDIATRHTGHLLLGQRHLRDKRFEEAAEAFEQALLYNADDPLAWWAKAVALRMADIDNQAELLNAHYLAPLEPALRAESFLSQPVSLDAEGSPLVAPLAENPGELIEVACLLIDCGLFDQANRWIDEALRHADLPMLRYLMAYCFLQGTRLDAEAFDNVQRASRSPIAPPFPYRDTEWTAIETLSRNFPQDSRLKTLLDIGARQRQ
ncbi:MAG: DUF5107 domain-containing protein [Fimbriimonas sp.]|nr:DUF5107 domain-containing protein [Fimbriimonas sp.]